MIIRTVEKNDINNNLLNLFIEGYNLHYDNRKDKFRKREKQRLKEILIEMMNNTDIIVIEENNKILGYLAYQIKEKIDKVLWIDELVVDENEQHKGYCRLLLDKVNKIAKEKNCNAVELCCWS